MSLHDAIRIELENQRDDWKQRFERAESENARLRADLEKFTIPKVHDSNCIIHQGFSHCTCALSDKEAK